MIHEIRNSRIVLLPGRGIHITHQVKRESIKASSIRRGASSAMKLIENTG